MNNITTIIILIILVLLSAFFSGTETAFSTCNRIRLRNQADKGNEKAEMALKLLEDFDKLITTTLIGNNFVNITMATLAAALFTVYFGNNGGPISTIVMTVIVLIFGEIIPKSLANIYSDSFVIAVVNIMRFLEFILAPLTFFFNSIKKLFNSFLNTNGYEEDSITNDELITMVNEVEKEGNLEAEESELVRSAIEFNDLAVRDILTPRIKVVAVNENWDKEKIRETLIGNPFSRLPVYHDDIDHIIGFIHEKDFFIELSKDEFNLKDILQPLITVPLSYSMMDALKLLQKNKTHLAIVMDEYGGTQGIITMEDILEELVGEIWDEHDKVEREIVQINDDTFYFTGSCSLVDMFDCFERHDEDHDRFDSDTVSGFVSEVLGRMPNRGESFDYENLKITVIDVDQKVIKRIRVYQQPFNTEK